MKQNLSAKAVYGAIILVIAIVGVVAYMFIKSDPAMQGPNKYIPFDRGKVNEADQNARRDAELRHMNGGANQSQRP